MPGLNACQIPCAALGAWEAKAGTPTFLMPWANLAPPVLVVLGSHRPTPADGWPPPWVMLFLRTFQTAVGLTRIFNLLSSVDP